MKGSKLIIVLIIILISILNCKGNTVNHVQGLEEYVKTFKPGCQYVSGMDESAFQSCVLEMDNDTQYFTFIEESKYITDHCRNLNISDPTWFVCKLGLITCLSRKEVSSGTFSDKVVEDCCIVELKELARMAMFNMLKPDCDCYFLTKVEYDNAYEKGTHVLKYGNHKVTLPGNVRVNYDSDACTVSGGEVDLSHLNSTEIVKEMAFGDATKFLFSDDVYQNVTKECNEKGYLTVGKIKIQCGKISYRACKTGGRRMWNKVTVHKLKEMCGKELGCKVLKYPKDMEVIKNTLMEKSKVYVITTHGSLFTLTSKIGKNADFRIYYAIREDAELISTSFTGGYATVKTAHKFFASASLINYNGKLIGIVAKHSIVHGDIQVCAKACTCARMKVYENELVPNHDLGYLVFKDASVLDSFKPWKPIRVEHEAYAVGYTDKGVVNITGRVRDTTNAYKEKLLYPFKTDENFQHGMSGGPIIQDDGVVGIVSQAESSGLFNMGKVYYVNMIPEVMLQKLSNEILEIDDCNVDDRTGITRALDHTGHYVDLGEQALEDFVSSLGSYF